MMLSTTSRLSELASVHPAAPRVLHAHGLDFCCGGAASLAHACEARGLDPTQVLAEVTSLSTPRGLDPRWNERPTSELIDHIITRYHHPLRSELPRLIELADKVERVHADKESSPRGLTTHLTAMQGEVSRHLDKEEQVLFPLILSGRGALTYGPISVITREHDDHGANLRVTRSFTADLTPPADACGSWRALYAGLIELEAELMEHIHLENNVLFPSVLTH